MKSLLAVALCLTVYVCNVSSSQAAEYPNRPIEMVIPFEAGSGIDIVGRYLADMVGKELGVKMVINNKPGGSGATGYTYVKNSKPDGYVLGMFNSTIASHKVFNNLPFDHRDVEILMLVQSSPSVLCVPTNSKYQTFEDVVEDAKKRPGEILWACSSGNLLNCSRDIWHHAGLQFKVVPFGGGGLQPVLQTSGGHVDMGFVNIVDSKPQIDAGNLRALVAYSNARLSPLPDVPTFEEYGLPVRTIVVRGVMAQPGMSQDRIEVLSNAFKKAVTDKKYIDFVEGLSGIALNLSLNQASNYLDQQRDAYIQVSEQEKMSP